MTSDKLEETIALAKWMGCADGRRVCVPEPWFDVERSDGVDHVAIAWPHEQVKGWASYARRFAPHDSDADAMEVLRALVSGGYRCEVGVSLRKPGLNRFTASMNKSSWMAEKAEFRHAIVAATLAVIGDE